MADGAPAAALWTPSIVNLTVVRGAGLPGTGAKRVGVRTADGAEQVTHDLRGVAGGREDENEQPWNRTFVFAFPPPAPEAPRQTPPLRVTFTSYVNGAPAASADVAVAASLIAKTGQWSSAILMSPAGSLHISITAASLGDDAGGGVGDDVVTAAAARALHAAGASDGRGVGAESALRRGIHSPRVNGGYIAAGDRPSSPAHTTSEHRAYTDAGTGRGVVLLEDCVQMLSTPVRALLEQPFANPPARVVCTPVVSYTGTGVRRPNDVETAPAPAPASAAAHTPRAHGTASPRALFADHQGLPTTPTRRGMLQRDAAAAAPRLAAAPAAIEGKAMSVGSPARQASPVRRLHDEMERRASSPVASTATAPPGGDPYTRMLACEARCEAAERGGIMSAWRAGVAEMAAAHAAASSALELAGMRRENALLRGDVPDVKAHLSLDNLHRLMKTTEDDLRTANAQLCTRYAASEANLAALRGNVASLYSSFVELAARWPKNPRRSQSADPHDQLADMRAGLADITAIIKQFNEHDTRQCSERAAAHDAQQERLACVEAHFAHSRQMCSFALCMKNLLVLCRAYWDKLRRSSIGMQHARELAAARKRRPSTQSHDELGSSYNDLRAAVDGAKKRDVGSGVLYAT